MNRTETSPNVSGSSAGFTLIELLVSLAVTTVLILGVLATFDFTARMNRVQMNVADMQQSLRVSQNEVVKLARMAGRGGLPANFAVQVRNNVAANTRLISTDATTAILEGTDTVTIRGVFSSSLYQVDYLNPATWTAPDALGEGGSVVVLEKSAGVPQSLADLKLKLKDKTGETLLLVTPFDTYAIAQISEDDLVEESDFEGTLDGLRLNFKSYAADAVLGGDLSPGLQAIAYVGILEEYVFYVRDVAAGGAAWAAGDVTPKLARARMLPGQNVLYAPGETFDIADGILDVQATLGFGVAGAPELRLSTLARTDRRDPDAGFRAPLLPAMVEDHAYATSHRFNADAQRRFRWRLMQSNINLRNL